MSSSGSTLSLSGVPVLVTGATGFIGSHLTRRLLHEGALVHGVRHTAAPDGAGRVEWHEGDLRDLGFVREILTSAHPDVVVHLAALVTGNRELGAVLPSIEHTFRSTVNLLIGATETSRPRFVRVGSVEEAGAPAEEPFPRSPYAAAKGAAASYARMFRALYDLPVVDVRPSMVYGPAQQDLGKLVPHAIVSMLRGERPRIHTPERLADWVYVDDVVDGLVAACVTRGATGSAVELGRGVVTSVRDVVTKIHELIGSETPPNFADGPGRPHECERPADTTSAKRVLGWRAQIDLEEGLSRTVDWYRDHLDQLTGNEA